MDTVLQQVGLMLEAFFYSWGWLIILVLLVGYFTASRQRRKVNTQPQEGDWAAERKTRQREQERRDRHSAGNALMIVFVVAVVFVLLMIGGVFRGPGQ